MSTQLLPFVFANGSLPASASGDAAADVVTFLSLPHPRHGTAVRFARTAHALLEIQAHAENAQVQPASWLIDNAVVKDGIIYVVTPIDPLFMLLSALDAAAGGSGASSSTAESTGAFCDISDVITGSLASLLELPHCSAGLAHMCDVKDRFGTRMVRFSAAKTLQWLRQKVERTARALQKLGQDATGAGSASTGEGVALAATSSSFTIAAPRSSTPVLSASASADSSSPASALSLAQPPSEFQLMTAIGLVGDYIDARRFDALCAAFNFTADEVAHRRRKGAASAAASSSSGTGSPLAFATSGGHSSPFASPALAASVDLDPSAYHSAGGGGSAADEAEKRKAAEKAQTLASKKLAKVDTKGMKSLSSFFGAKK
jgi:ribonuclease H2 subunit B